MSTRVVITGPEHYPYGAFGEAGYTDSTYGCPPLLNPAIGKLFLPRMSDDQKMFPVFALKLEDAILAAVPEGTGPILKFGARTASHMNMVAHNSLMRAAFVLGEVDPGHYLLKIATLTDFDEFCAAVNALDA